MYTHARTRNVIPVLNRYLSERKKPTGLPVFRIGFTVKLEPLQIVGERNSNRAPHVPRPDLLMRAMSICYCSCCSMFVCFHSAPFRPVWSLSFVSMFACFLSCLYVFVRPFSCFTAFFCSILCLCGWLRRVCSQAKSDSSSRQYDAVICPLST